MPSVGWLVPDARSGGPRLVAVPSPAVCSFWFAMSNARRSTYVGARVSEGENRRFSAACRAVGFTPSDGLRAALEAFADAITESLKSRDQGVENPGLEVPAKAEGRPATLAQS